MSRIKFLSLIAIGLLHLNCNPQTTIAVEISGETSGTIRISSFNLENNKYSLLRAGELSQQGRFIFEVPSEPNLYQLSFGGQRLEVVNDGDRVINITIDKSKKTSPISVDGSKATQLLYEYNSLVITMRDKYLSPLEPMMREAMASNNKERIREIESLHRNNMQLFVQTLKKKIDQMSTSLALFAVVRTLDFNKYLSHIETWSRTFEESRPGSNFALALAELVSDAKKRQIGAEAPNISLSRLSDQKMQYLHEFRGHEVVLVDFWASWCLPCRKENPKLKTVYNRYNTQGFTIWGISTDKDRSAWLTAVERDELPWINSNSVNSNVEETYGVVSLPTNFLIDREGLIIARNISAEELDRILSKMFE